MSDQSEYQFTVDSYRCLSAPVEFTIGDGITAFVGPNNAGKSTILRLIYELRNLWVSLPGDPHLSVANKRVVGVDLRDAHSPEEVLCDWTGKPPRIKINLPVGNAGLSSTDTSEIHLVGDVIQPNRWNTMFLTVPRVDLTERELRNAELRPAEIVIPGRSTISYRPVLDFVSTFGGAIYLGAFRNIVTQGTAEYFGINIGSAFVGEWHEWKTGESRAKNRKIGEVTETIRDLLGFRSLDISSSTRLGTLQVTIDGRAYKLKDVGAGVSQVIIALATVALRSPALILIDEPETHLHPALQVRFLMCLAKFASKGIVMATHSIGLARAVAQRTYSLSRKQNTVSMRPLAASDNYPEMLGEMGFSAMRELGCNKVLLVEGPHDTGVWQHFLRLYSKEAEVVTIPLGGDSMINGSREAHLRELLRLGVPILAAIDSERREKGAEIAPNRRDFERLCESLEIRCLVTERRAIENYFPRRAVELAVGSGALGEYEALSARQPPWGKAKNAVIASNMARGDIADTDVGSFLQSI